MLSVSSAAADPGLGMVVPVIGAGVGAPKIRNLEHIFNSIVETYFRKSANTQTDKHKVVLSVAQQAN